MSPQDPSRAAFEVGVYNEHVRELVQSGGSHPVYNDNWADLCWIEISAPDLASARKRALSKDPKNLGFVVVEVVPRGDGAHGAGQLDGDGNRRRERVGAQRTGLK